MITRSQLGIVKPIDHLSLHTSSISLIPENPSHALEDPNWRNAMYDEYNVLVKNGTWLLGPRPAGVNMTLSLDVKPATIRTVLILAVSRQWPIHQLDVKNAFLNDDLSEIVYMHQPPGFVDNRYPHHIMPHELDFIIVIAIPHCLSIDKIIGPLNNNFDISADRTDLGALNYFLGISTDRTPTGLFLSQKKYALQLLQCAHMVTCNIYQTPVDTESKLGPEVQQICLYMHDLREPHLAALKGILRYVQGTLDLGLQLYASSIISLVGYTNADWAGCPSIRMSTSGYYVFLGDNLLSWSAKRQHTLSRFSDKAEYQGVANVVAETAWLCNVLRELHSLL
ncbi:ribonuclease H-like domain-containing protein [Tanacetum coccineum]